MDKAILHVGCGGSPLPEWLSHFKETRLDINPDCKPDIVANMMDLGEIGKFDAILSIHSFEHLYPHEVKKTLSEFKRVLNDGGAVIIFVPDLEGVQATEDVLFEAPCGEITGLDLIYGHRDFIEDMPFMAHHNGFTSKTLHDTLANNGFSKVKVTRLSNYDMMGVAVK